MSNKRKLKPQVKVVLIILGVIVGLIIIENVIGGISTLIKNAKAQIEYNKKQELYEQTPAYEEEQKISEFLNQMVTYLSNKNYEELFKLVDPEYKESLNITTVDEFKVIVEDYIGKDVLNVKLMDYYLYNDRYVCEVSVEQEGITDVTDILVTPKGDDNFYIVLDEVQKIEKFDNQYRIFNEDLTYNIKYKIKKAKAETFVIEATNNTANAMIGSFAESILAKSGYFYCSVKNSDTVRKVELPAGETVTFSLTFNDEKYDAFSDESIDIILKLENGTKITKTITLVLPDDY